jgi:protein required for attachment to host cells
MTGTWIVVADRSRARFFVMESRIEPLQELDGMVHVEGRHREQDEVSDRQGGIAGGHGEGGHAFAAPTDLKHHEADLFAGQIAEKLEQGRINHNYRKLILVAPPAFLGALRHALNEHVLQLISTTVDKNLVSEDEAVIREHVL